MLGTQVKTRRKQQQLSQKQLAERAGLEQFHISRIERGDIHDIKGDTLKRLAMALNVTTDSLLEMPIRVPPAPLVLPPRDPVAPGWPVPPRTP
jgi:transcriptional regulator with XRE-family HTH domain